MVKLRNVHQITCVFSFLTFLNSPGLMAGRTGDQGGAVSCPMRGAPAASSGTDLRTLMIGIRKNIDPLDDVYSNPILSFSSQRRAQMVGSTSVNAVANAYLDALQHIRPASSLSARLKETHSELDLENSYLRDIKIHLPLLPLESPGGQNNYLKVFQEKMAKNIFPGVSPEDLTLIAPSNPPLSGAVVYLIRNTKTQQILGAFKVNNKHSLSELLDYTVSEKLIHKWSPSVATVKVLGIGELSNGEYITVTSAAPGIDLDHYLEHHFFNPHATSQDRVNGSHAVRNTAELLSQLHAGRASRFRQQLDNESYETLKEFPRAYLDFTKNKILAQNGFIHQARNSGYIDSDDVRDQIIEVTAKATQAYETLLEQSKNGTGVVPTLVHFDSHGGNIFVDEKGNSTLIDYGGLMKSVKGPSDFGIGDPACDIGKMTASLQIEALKNGKSVEESVELARIFLEQYKKSRNWSGGPQEERNFDVALDFYRYRFFALQSSDLKPLKFKPTASSPVSLEVLRKRLYQAWLTPIDALQKKHIQQPSVWRDSSNFQKHEFGIQYPEPILRALHRLPSESSPQDVLSQCANKTSYLDAMKNLEASVAQVALNTPRALESLKDLNQRMLDLIEASAEANLAAQHAAKDKAPPTSEEIEKEVDRLLSQYFGDCKVKDMGCVGKNPKAIREVFRNGNLRERSWLYSVPGYKILEEEVFACPASLSDASQCRCKDPLKGQILQVLGKKHSARAFQPIRDAFELKCLDVLQGRPFHDKGRYAAANKPFKEARTSAGMDQFSVENLSVPLSAREAEFLAQEHVPVDRTISFWTTGFKLWQPKPVNTSQPNHPDPQNLYYSGAQAHGFPVQVAISGTSDMALNQAVMFGASSQQNLEYLRLSLLGFMIPYQHHTAYEILTAGRSFNGLEINPNSDWYKHLLSNPTEQAHLTTEIESYYRRHFPGTKLPTEEFKNCIEEIH